MSPSRGQLRVLRTVPVDVQGDTNINDNDEHDERAGAWTWTVDGTLGAGLTAGGDWAEELPWQSVAPGEAAGLIAAYRQARQVTRELHAVLVAAGVDPVELAELCPSLDAAGRPVVVLGRVSARTARQLCALLGQPDAA